MRIMGVAASAASLIAMAGTTIEMPENTFMVLRRPMTAATHALFTASSVRYGAIPRVSDERDSPLR